MNEADGQRLDPLGHAEQHHHRLIGERHEFVYDKKDCPACQAEGEAILYIFTGQVDEGIGDEQMQVTVFKNGAADVSFRRDDNDTWGPPTLLESREVE